MADPRLRQIKIKTGVVRRKFQILDLLSWYISSLHNTSCPALRVSRKEGNGNLIPLTSVSSNIRKYHFSKLVLGCLLETARGATCIANCLLTRPLCRAEDPSETGAPRRFAPVQTGKRKSYVRKRSKTARRKD